MFPSSLPVGDPTKYFDLSKIRNAAELSPTFHINEERKSTIYQDRMFRYMELTFCSQIWHGAKWDHHARIYIPDSYEGHGNVGIIGTHRLYTPENEYKLGEAEHFKRGTLYKTEIDAEKEFCERTALDFGIPIMIFGNPGNQVFGLDEGDLMGFSLQKIGETGDLSWYGYAAIARGYLRAITLLTSLPEIRAQRAVLMGHSKRGLGIIIASRVDPERVVGVLSSGQPGGNTLDFICTKFSEFGRGSLNLDYESSGPGFISAEKNLEGFNTPIGFLASLMWDPYMWHDKLTTPIMIALGTNDELLGTECGHALYPYLKSDKAMVTVENLPHTWAAEKILAGWRIWLAHIYFGRSLPQVTSTAKITTKEVEIQIVIKSSSPVKAVRVFYAYNKKNDWRQITWNSTTISQIPSEKGSYLTTLPLKAEHNFGYFVQVEDYEEESGSGFVATPVSLYRY